MLAFRLWTIFYVFALVAAAMSTFGPGGIVFAAGVLGIWGWVFFGRGASHARLFELLIVCFIIGTLLALLLPAVNTAREAARRNTCLGHVKQLVTCLLNYHQMNGSFPPANVADANGNAMLSWRVLMLPLMEEQALFNRIDRSKAWDDPGNRQATSTTIFFWNCPSHYSQAPITDYFAVIGPQTAWPESRGRSIREITDGPENTILLIEVEGRQISWAEPRDLTFDEAVDLLTQAPASDDGHWINNGFFYKTSRGRNVAFADGRVAFLEMPLDRELATALLTVDGGEEINQSDLQRAEEPQLDYGKCYGFSVFVFLSLLPAAWIRRQRATATRLRTQEQDNAGEREAGVGADVKGAI